MGGKRVLSRAERGFRREADLMIYTKSRRSKQPSRAVERDMYDGRLP